MKVDRLVLRERVLESGPRLLRDPLERRTRHVNESPDRLELALRRLEERHDRLDVAPMVDDLHVPQPNRQRIIRSPVERVMLELEREERVLHSERRVDLVLDRVVLPFVVVRFPVLRVERNGLADRQRALLDFGLLDAHDLLMNAPFARPIEDAQSAECEHRVKVLGALNEVELERVKVKRDEVAVGAMRVGPERERSRLELGLDAKHHRFLGQVDRRDRILLVPVDRLVELLPLLLVEPGLTVSVRVLLVRSGLRSAPANPAEPAGRSGSGGGDDFVVTSGGALLAHLGAGDGAVEANVLVAELFLEFGELDGFLRG